MSCLVVALMVFILAIPVFAHDTSNTEILEELRTLRQVIDPDKSFENMTWWKYVVWLMSFICEWGDCLVAFLAIIPTALLIIALFFVWVLSCVTSRRDVHHDDPLVVRRLPTGERQLQQDLTIVIGNRSITVRKGFKTDYSSMPFGFRWTMHWSKVDVAGVVHDWLYAKAKSGEITKLQADRIWWDIALNGGHSANRLQAAAGWLALVIFGLVIWQRYKRNKPESKFQDIPPDPPE